MDYHFLTESNKDKIKLILACESSSENTKEIVERYASANNIPCYIVPSHVMDSLYPTKHVKVLALTNRQAALKNRKFNERRYNL